jgi:hypothetical protein
MFVDAWGEVCPCDVMPLSFGNLNEKPLAVIWEEMAGHFSQPRCACAMNAVAPMLSIDEGLPVIPERSRALVLPPCEGDPVPAAYEPLFAQKGAMVGQKNLENSPPSPCRAG